MPPVRPILEAAARVEDALQPLLERAFADSKTELTEKFLKDVQFGALTKETPNPLSALNGLSDGDASKLLPATDGLSSVGKTFSGPQLQVEDSGFRDLVRQWSPFTRSDLADSSDFTSAVTANKMLTRVVPSEQITFSRTSPLLLEENGTARRFLLDKVGAPALINSTVEQSEWFQPAGIKRLKDLYEIATSNTVRVHAYDDPAQFIAPDAIKPSSTKHWNMYGSGFFINDDKDVLASLHVLGDLRSAHIYTNSSVSIGGKARNDWLYDVYKRFPDEDLVWLKTSALQREQMPATRLVPDAPAEPTIQDRRVVGFGHPLGNAKLHFSPGIDTKDTVDVPANLFGSGVKFENLFAPRMRVKLGVSGGPIYDFEGRNRGMLKARFDINGGDEHAVVVQMSRIRARLSSD